MPVLTFLFLLLCYLLSGYGLLNLFGMRLKAAHTITLSLLLGVAVASFIPFLLQLFYIVITGPTVFGALLLAALLLNIPSFLQIRKEGGAAFMRRFRPGRLSVRPYELPYWLIIGFLIFVSVWRCYYLPPTSRDALSGPETIAEFTVREQTMINSFFRIDLWSTNNQFKSPFLISLQIIYKLAGFPFGQVWLSIVFICFVVFLYNALTEKLHPIIAGLLLLLFLMTPEMYAYTFMILYDYSNMVFYFLGLYFLFRALASPGSPPTIVRPPAALAFAGLLFGIATYIRSETLVLVALLLPLILIAQFRDSKGLRKMALVDFFFLLPSLIGYYLPTQLYIKYYLPVHYDIGTLVNNHLSDLHPLWQRYSDIVTRLLFGTFAINLWGYLFYIACALFLAELIFVRRFNKQARNWLYAMLMLYLALGILGFALPMFNLLETTKRALFKMMPLVLLYLANNELLLRLSRRISQWEALPRRGGSSSQPAVAASAGDTPATRKSLSPAGGAGSRPNPSSKKKSRKK
ncbi:MAG TPA: hypothetical protein VK518_18935 [Puia sp.]|nr:hypothetical protein [Puia sp.]